MKSEHRHELKTSELGRLLERVRPFFDQYSNHIIAVLVLLLIAAIVWTSYSSQAISARSEGWDQWAKANNAEDYGNLADKYPNDDVGVWAKLVESEFLLRSGIRQSFVNRDAGNSDTKAALEGFESLLARENIADNYHDVHVRALFGMARALETRNDGKTDSVVAAYEKLSQACAGDPTYAEYKKMADERVKALKEEPVQDFYAWFKAQNPKPEDRKDPLDGAGATSTGPGDDEDLDISELLKGASGTDETKSAPKFPTFPPVDTSGDKDKSDESSPSKEEAEKPAADASKPAGDAKKPAAEEAEKTEPKKPEAEADAKPEAENKPAEPKADE